MVDAIRSLALGSQVGQGLADTIRQSRARSMFGDAVGSELAAQDPRLFLQQQALEDQERQREEQQRQMMIDEAAKDARTALQINDPEERQALFAQRIARIQNRGGDPSDTIRLASMDIASQDRELRDVMNRAIPFSSMIQAEGSQATPASVRETEWFLQQDEDTQKQHLELKRKSDPTLAEQLEKAKALSEVKVTEAGEKETAKGSAQRRQGFIDSGIDAADSLASMTRALQLLDQVETGGFDNVALRAKRLFGIESADEAELSAELGRAVLSQLKPIFGSAFTAQEGERLERIEASFGKSTEGNRRLLRELIKKTSRAARRGLAAARQEKDEFTAQEIQAALDAIEQIDETIDGGQTSDQQEDGTFTLPNGVVVKKVQ